MHRFQRELPGNRIEERIHRLGVLVLAGLVTEPWEDRNSVSTSFPFNDLGADEHPHSMTHSTAKAPFAPIWLNLIGPFALAI